MIDDCDKKLTELINKALALGYSQGYDAAKTIEMIDESIENSKKGKLGGIFNPDDFKDLLEEKKNST